jgi:hypothetical protein
MSASNRKDCEEIVENQKMPASAPSIGPQTASLGPNELIELGKIVDENFANENFRRLGKTSSEHELNDKIDLNVKEIPLDKILDTQRDSFTQAHRNKQTIKFEIHVDETYNQADSKGSLALISIQFEQTTDGLQEEQQQIHIGACKIARLFLIIK